MNTRAFRLIQFETSGTFSHTFCVLQCTCRHDW